MNINSQILCNRVVKVSLPLIFPVYMENNLTPTTILYDYFIRHKQA